MMKTNFNIQKTLFLTINIVFLPKMRIIYSNHAIRRMKQRSISKLQVEFILSHPKYVMRSYEGIKVATGFFDKRRIKVVYLRLEKYLKVITVV